MAALVGHPPAALHTDSSYGLQTQRVADRVAYVYEQYANTEGMLPVDKLEGLLNALSIDPHRSSYSSVLHSVSGGSREISMDQTMAVCSMLSTDNLPASLSNMASTSDASSPSKNPLKKVLTKNRYYMETGNLSYDEAVLQYLAKLDEHRRKCESEGRYQEAKVAAKRLADLKTAQVERLRQELVSNQQKELSEVHKVYEEETAKFHHIWDSRVREYERNFAGAVEDLKAGQAQQLAAFVDEIQRKRPQKPRGSREYREQRVIQDNLAKSKMYSKATRVKEMADELYQAEWLQTLAAWEADTKMKIAKFQAKQRQQEFEALLQRGARGRDELELKRVSETERRTLRFRNIVAELENLHKLEVVHLENFLDAQVQAGKAVPLKDGFKRKREQLLSTPF